MRKTTTKTAGIDIAKAHLDLAVDRDGLQARFANTPEGWEALAIVCVREGVERIGAEATGGYEAGIVAHLREAGFPVAVLQPIQVRAYARIRLRRAKNDRLDARLIAAFVADVDRMPTPRSPELAALARRLTFLEQTEEDIARLKVRLEHVADADLRALVLADIAAFKARRATLLAEVVRALRDDADLGRRFDLLLSIPGVGPRTAIALLVHLPELGSISREEIAALAGLAPWDRDSGTRAGARHIAGGRARVRRSLYAAALPAAYRWNPALIALKDRLIARAKPPKVALVACARKLLVYANAVIARGTPWLDTRQPV